MEINNQFIQKAFDNWDMKALKEIKKALFKKEIWIEVNQLS